MHERFGKRLGDDLTHRAAFALVKRLNFPENAVVDVEGGSHRYGCSGAIKFTVGK